MLKIRLPSGRMAPVYDSSDPLRPWEVCDEGGVYSLRRDRRGSSGDTETYNPQGIRAAPVFDKPDAVALAVALNAQPGRKATPRPSSRTSLP